MLWNIKNVRNMIMLKAVDFILYSLLFFALSQHISKSVYVRLIDLFTTY